jgi:glycopeptide antibiotics resistance protein
MLISVPYIYIVAVLFVIWTIYRIIAVLKSKEKNRYREVAINIFFIYFLILMGLTIFKGSNLSIMFENKLYVNYIPFMETINMFKNNYMNYMGIRNAVYNVVGNILVFVPLGFLIPLLFEMKNKIIYIALYGFLT